MTEMSNPHTQAAVGWLGAFEAALARNDVDAAVAMFEPDATGATSSRSPGTSRPMEGREQIRDMLRALPRAT